MKGKRSAAGLVMLGIACAASAQTLVSGSYTENFDGLANTGTANAWTQDGSVPEWWAYRFPATTGLWTDVTVYIANNGSTANGSLYSFGPTGSSDRALGSVGSGNAAAGDFRYGTGFTNGFANAISAVTISYRGEQWRGGTTGNTNAVEFQYSVTASGVGDDSATWIDHDPLDYQQARNDVSGPIDGNANFVLRSSTITGLNLAPGSTIWIRWFDDDHIGTDHGLAVDDFTADFQTVPEPASMAALAVGVLALARRRSKKS